MSFIEFKDVVKRYTVGEQEIYAANGVSFTIEQGNSASSWAPPARARPPF